jgi:hypothetical protein
MSDAGGLPRADDLTCALMQLAARRPILSA